MVTSSVDKYVPPPQANSKKVNKRVRARVEKKANKKQKWDNKEIGCSKTLFIILWESAPWVQRGKSHKKSVIRSAVNDYLKKNALGVIRSDVLDVAYIREDMEDSISVILNIHFWITSTSWKQSIRIILNK